MMHPLFPNDYHQKINSTQEVKKRKQLLGNHCPHMDSDIQLYFHPNQLLSLKYDVK